MNPEEIITIGQIIEFVDHELDKRSSNKSKIDFANQFRHMNHKYGDFISEYALTKLIHSIESKPMNLNYAAFPELSEAYLHLSQTYGHLLFMHDRITDRYIQI